MNIYDGVLDVAIPDHHAIAVTESCYGGEEATRKLVVLEQVYRSVTCQENIRAICKIFADQCGVRLIAVEGADGLVAAKTDSNSVAELVRQRSAVSAGVEVLLSIDRPDVYAWGVDDLNEVTKSHEAARKVMGAAAIRDDFFRNMRAILQAGQNRCYPSVFTRLRRSQLAIYGRWKKSNNPDHDGFEQALTPPRDQIFTRFDRAARTLRIELREFPVLAMAVLNRRISRRFDDQTLIAQQIELSRRVQAHLLDWIKSEDGMDLAEAVPLIEFWMEKTNLDFDELRPSLNDPADWASTLLRACEWTYTWLVEAARAARNGQVDSTSIIEEQMRLALRLGIPYFDLNQLRDWVAYTRQSKGMSVSAFTTQITEFCQMLATAIKSREALRLFDVEENLELLFHAMRLELTPTEAEAVTLQGNALSRWVINAKEIAQGRWRTGGHLKPSVLDECLESAHEFYESSRKRGRILVERTLEFMRLRNEETALLVAGGFHHQAIKETLEDHRNVSWSVVLPKF